MSDSYYSSDKQHLLYVSLHFMDFLLPVFKQILRLFYVQNNVLLVELA